MKYRFFASILLSISVFFCFPVFALAQENNYGLDATAGAAGIPTSKGITTILGDVVGAGLSLVSVLFFALMLYAGIKWMLARGDEANATKALDTIVGAIIGLVIVLASYALTTFVFKSVGGGEGVGGPSSKPKVQVPPPGTGKCIQKAGIVDICNVLTSQGEEVCNNSSTCEFKASKCVPLFSAGDCADLTTKLFCEDPAIGLESCTWKP